MAVELNRHFFEINPSARFTQKIDEMIRPLWMVVKDLVEWLVQRGSFFRDIAPFPAYPFEFLARRTRLEMGEVVLGGIPLLKQLHPNRFRVMNFDDAGLEHRFVCAPILMRTGKKGRHWVIAIYDREQQGRLEFYDSRGKTYKECVKQDRTITDIMRRLMQEVEPAAPLRVGVFSNRKIHQFDRVNCGVYILRYLDLRCAGRTPEQIAQAQCGFIGIHQYRRRLLADARRLRMI